MKKKTIINILMVICIFVALGCGGYLAYYYYTSSKTEEAFDELRDMVIEESIQDSEEVTKQLNLVDVDGVMVQKKFEKLYRQNKHFMGWIKIQDTNVDYPVMYTPENMENGEYYIHRDFEENYSAAGLPFVDSNCKLNPPTDNVIIYGHNMNSGKMFHDILKYEDKEFYETHKRFRFDTIYENGTYEVVAIIRAQILPEESKEFKYYEFVNAGTEESFLNYVDNIKRMSQIDTGVDVKYGDHLLTLSTCAYHTKDGRFAIIAKKVEE